MNDLEPPAAVSSDITAVNPPLLPGRTETPGYCAAQAQVLAFDEHARIALSFMDSDDSEDPISFSEVRIRDFLLAMLQYAPLVGLSYVIGSIEAHSNGRLGYLAGVWYWGLICPLFASARKSQSIEVFEPPTVQDPEGAAVEIDPEIIAQSTFYFEVCKREGDRSSVCRLRAVIEGKRQVLGKACYILPFSLSPGSKTFPEVPSTWSMLASFSGIHPAELSGIAVNRVDNGLLLSSDECELWDDFAWTLKPDTDDRGAAVPHQYRVHRYRDTEVCAVAAEGALVRFTDARPGNQLQPGQPAPTTSDLPNPKYLDLHSALADVIHVSGAAEDLENIFGMAEDGDAALASDGSTPVALLLLTHQLLTTK